MSTKEHPYRKIARQGVKYRDGEGWIDSGSGRLLCPGNSRLVTLNLKLGGVVNHCVPMRDLLHIFQIYALPPPGWEPPPAPPVDACEGEIAIQSDATNTIVFSRSVRGLVDDYWSRLTRDEVPITLLRPLSFLPSDSIRLIGLGARDGTEVELHGCFDPIPPRTGVGWS
jgi:hypothetical protein